ncbi:MAG: sigma-70 family RNA polymerase sigma factor [Lentisphaerae bacterium]|nr:sigma-70 family RNA polymerase sigma factor [Lentisphaerota bacterium]
MQTTRQSLLERMRDASATRAWEEFYELYWGVIVRYAQKQGLNEASAHEVLQETMVTLIRVLPAFRYDRRRGQFRNFLLTIVHRRALSELRRIRRRHEVSLDTPAGEDEEPLIERLAEERVPAPSDIMEARWRESLREEALRRVRDDPRVQGRTFEVFRAYAIDGLPAEEVAARFGVKENAVYQIKDRVLKRLRQEVELLRRELADPRP